MPKLRVHFIALLLALPLASATAMADITLAPLFRDHAVLQRNQAVPDWGRADPGDKITVSFRDQTVGTTAEADGRWIASGEGSRWREGDGGEWRLAGRAQLRLWDGQSGQVARTLPFDAPVEAVAFSPSGARLAARSGDAVVVFDTQRGDELGRFAVGPDEGRAPGGLVFAGESRLLAREPGGVRVWSLARDSSDRISLGTGPTALGVSPGGGHLLAFDDNGLRGLWSVADGQRLVEPVAGLAPVSAWMPGDGALLLLDGRELRQLRWSADALLAEGCRRAGGTLSDAEWARYLPDAEPPGACEGR